MGVTQSKSEKIVTYKKYPCGACFLLVPENEHVYRSNMRKYLCKKCNLII